MKITNFVLVFVIAILGFIPFTDYKVNNLIALNDQGTQYNSVLDLALDTAVASIVEADDGTVHVNRDECVKAFMRSLYAGFGIIDNPSLCAELDMYVPIIVIADVDGFYVRYYEYQENDHVIVSKWSTKYPYTYTDSYSIINFRLDDDVQLIVKGYDTVYDGNYKTLVSKYSSIAGANSNQYNDLVNACSYVENVFTSDGVISNVSPLRDSEHFALERQKTVIKCITEKMSYYLNKHNDIARSYGIQYTFHLPESAASEMARTISDITFMGIFQGYPMGTGTDDVYNKFCISGSRIVKGNNLYVRKDPATGYLYYHTSRCSLGQNVGSNAVTYDSARKAAATGALPCPYCHP